MIKKRSEQADQCGWDTKTYCSWYIFRKSDLHDVVDNDKQFHLGTSEFIYLILEEKTFYNCK